MTLDGRLWLASRPVFYTPDEVSSDINEREAGWTPEALWALQRRDKSPLLGIELPFLGRSTD